MTHMISGFVLIALIGTVVFSGCTSPSNSITVAGPSGTAKPVQITLAVAESKSTTSASSLPAGMSRHTYLYVLNGQKRAITVALSDQVYADYKQKSDPDDIGSDARDNSTYFLKYINDPEQQPYIQAIADAIRAETPDRDNQARIATSLVQHIPYKEGASQYRYPYEVLYKNQGICGEKSMLLALLLKELGFGSAVFYFLPEDHMAAGIRVASPYDFRNSGYGFIEATEPFIITDSMTDNLAAQKYTKTMEITPVGTGSSLESVATDATDARQWANYKAQATLPPAEYAAYTALDAKYDLSNWT